MEPQLQPAGVANAAAPEDVAPPMEISIQDRAQAAVDLGSACFDAAAGREPEDVSLARVHAALNVADPNAPLYTSDGKVCKYEGEGVTATTVVMEISREFSTKAQPGILRILNALADAGSTDAEVAKAEAAQRLLGGACFDLEPTLVNEALAFGADVNFNEYGYSEDNDGYETFLMGEREIAESYLPEGPMTATALVVKRSRSPFHMSRGAICLEALAQAGSAEAMAVQAERRRAEATAEATAIREAAIRIQQ